MGNIFYTLFPDSPLDWEKEAIKWEIELDRLLQQRVESINLYQMQRVTNFPKYRPRNMKSADFFDDISKASDIFENVLKKCCLKNHCRYTAVDLSLPAHYHGFVYQ